MYIITKIETIYNQELYNLWVKDTKEKGKDVEKEFPPPITHEIICLGYIVIDDQFNIHALNVGHVGQETERSILQSFSSFVKDCEADIISWNGKRFDLPVIVYRCLHHLVPLSWYYGQSSYRYRYTPDGHFDLADYISDHFSSPRPKLDYMAKLIGLPGRLWDPSNIDVMYLHSEINTIAEFCITDTIQIYATFLRIMNLRGLLTESLYYDAINNLYVYLEKTKGESQDAKALGCELFLNHWNI